MRAPLLLLPTLEPALPLRQFLERVDGILLTGSVSNIEPHHYSDESSYEGNLLDPKRDATNLKLIPLAFIYRFVFVLLIDITKLFATIEEFMNVQMTWGKLERLGRIS